MDIVSRDTTPFIEVRCILWGNLKVVFDHLTGEAIEVRARFSHQVRAGCCGSTRVFRKFYQVKRGYKRITYSNPDGPAW